MPKWPRSSGPLRKELGRAVFIVAFRHGRAKARSASSRRCPGMTLLSLLAISSSTCGCECHITFDRARRADEGADHLGILDAWRALHTGRNIDAAGAGDA